MSNKIKNPFHIAIPVHDLEICKNFYQQNFQCELGRQSDTWIDLNFYGHQFVLHLDNKRSSKMINQVDAKSIPVPHYGVILEWNQWEELVQRLNKNSVSYIVEPYIRFKDQAGEQGTLFIQDPSGNALEFKTFRDFKQIFAK